MGAGDHRRRQGASSVRVRFRPGSKLLSPEALPTDSPLRQRQQGRDAAELARRPDRRASSTRSARRVAAGAPGITVHPRADRRHITPDDVREIARRAANAAARGRIQHRRGSRVPELLDLVDEVRPDQCTLVPVVPGEVTSQAGWQAGPERDRLPGVVGRLKALGVRVSLFVDAEPDPIRWAASAGADRVELYTEPFARAVRTRTRGRVAVRSRSMPKRRGSRIRSAWASTPATIWISTIS